MTHRETKHQPKFSLWLRPVSSVCVFESTATAHDLAATSPTNACSKPDTCRPPPAHPTPPPPSPTTAAPSGDVSPPAALSITRRNSTDSAAIGSPCKTSSRDRADGASNCLGPSDAPSLAAAGRVGGPPLLPSVLLLGTAEVLEALEAAAAAAAVALPRPDSGRKTARVWSKPLLARWSTTRLQVHGGRRGGWGRGRGSAFSSLLSSVESKITLYRVSRSSVLPTLVL